MKSIDREILRIALPSIVSNITVPLLGLVDVTIVGHLGSPAYIGAIARLYRSDCCGRHAVQHYLLAFRFPADGHQRHDLASLRTARPTGDTPPAGAIRGIGRADSRVVDHPANANRTGCFPLHPSDGRNPGVGHHLFPHLHLGRTGHAGAVRIDGLVHRHAKLAHPHGRGHHAKRGEHRGQPVLCLLGPNTTATCAGSVWKVCGNARP